MIGLTSRRSSSRSPTPINFTGNSNSRLTATTLPPRALPSNLVSTRPLRPTCLFQTLVESSAVRLCATSRTRRAHGEFMYLKLISHFHPLLSINVPESEFSFSSALQSTHHYYSSNAYLRSECRVSLLLLYPTHHTRQQLV